MARALSEEKRDLIKSQSKKLFASRGFASTSVADIARVAELPVGSIYTYFTNKEEIIRAIVEEGWSDIRERLEGALSHLKTPYERVQVLLDTYLIELLEDVDFITILLSEGIEFTRIEEKIEELTQVIDTTLAPLAHSGALGDFTRNDMQAALMVYFFGVLNAVRVCNTTNLKLTSKDVLSFLRLTVRNALGVSV